MKPSSINKHYSAQDWEAVKRVRSWLGGAPRRSQAALSKMSGVASGTLSQILAGKYQAPPGEHLRKLMDVIERDEIRSSEVLDIPFQQTSVAQAVWGIIRRAQRDRDFGVFAARVGLGKTVAARQYCADTPSARYLRAFPGMTAVVLLRQLVTLTDAMVRQAGRRGGTISEMTSAVIEACAGTDITIVVDEAETLSPRALEYLRAIGDSAGIGITLIGTAALVSMIYDRDGRFGQISSRVGLWPPVAEVITMDDVILLATAFVGERPSAAALEALHAKCEGSARALRNLVRNCWRTCRAKGIELGPEVVAQVEASTMLGRRGRRAA